eukprot:4457693-Pyramimonas_sp.AAC.3
MGHRYTDAEGRRTHRFDVLGLHCRPAGLHECLLLRQYGDLGCCVWGVVLRDGGGGCETRHLSTPQYNPGAIRPLGKLGLGKDRAPQMKGGVNAHRSERRHLNMAHATNE